MEMIPMATDQSAASDVGTRAFRCLRPIMRQGTASSIPETWTKYASVEEAQSGAKHMDHDDRVLRVIGNGPDVSSWRCRHGRR